MSGGGEDSGGSVRRPRMRDAAVGRIQDRAGAPGFFLPCPECKSKQVTTSTCYLVRRMRRDSLGFRNGIENRNRESNE